MTTLLKSFCLLVILQGSLAQALTVGSISSAMAGAGRSSVDIGESYLLNPASVAHLQGAAMAFGTSYLEWTNPQDNSKATYDGWRLSLNENSPDSMWASSIYMSQSQNRQSRRSFNAPSQFNDAWFTLGNFVIPQVSMGLSYHYHESLTALQSYQEHNLGIGVLWTPLDHLGVGFSLQNFRAPPKDVPSELSLGSNGGIGLMYLHQDYLRLRLDYSRKAHQLPSLSSNEWAFGLENAMTPWTLVRIGIAQEVNDESQSTQKLTAGFGFAGPRFGVHYGFQQLRVAKVGTEHSVDLMIPF
jgi:hypothetical protein